MATGMPKSFLGGVECISMVKVSRLWMLAAVWLICTAFAVRAESFADWRSGDLIFQDSNSSQAAAIRLATASQYSHMGIIRVSGHNVTVIEAARTVSETPLQRFIARGVGQDYAVYRIRDLSPADAERALAAAADLAGKPYDIFFRLGSEAVYCSELPYYAFGTIGLNLGEVQLFGDLAIDTPEGRALFLARWQDHPDCQAQGLDREACWAAIQQQEIVTPVSIARDPAVMQVYSTFSP